MEWIEIVYVVSTFLLGLYYWSTWTYDYWKSRKIAGPTPLPYIGNLKDVLTGKHALATQIQTFYNDYREEPVAGFYILREPVLMLNDLDLIKDLLIRDFSNFDDRGLRIYQDVEPLTQHLVNLEPARWRPIRKRLTPLHSRNKVKEKFHLLLESGDELDKYLNKLSVTNEIVECQELTAKYATDTIGTYAYSMRMHSLDGPGEFRNMGRKLLGPNWKNSFKLRLRESSPFLFSIFGHLFCDTDITGFFRKLLVDTMEHRKKHGIFENDYIDLIMDLREHPEKLGEIETTESLLTSQLFLFFIAGFETTSTAMSHALLELAQNQSIQDKLRKEIHDALAENDGKFNYEVVKSMKYLDMVFNETLRKYPPVCILTRKSRGEYTFAGTNATIPEGARVIVPVFAIHRDPKIWPKPEVFDPERFTEEAIRARHPMSYMPFGGGPKHCIGINFGTYQSKVGLIKVLQNHKVEVCEKTQLPWVIHPRSVFLAAAGGVHLKISKVQ